MGSSDGLPNSRSTITPFPCVPPHYYNNKFPQQNVVGVVGSSGSIPNPTPAVVGSSGSIPNPTPVDTVGRTMSHHQRCSSESVLQVEEKPSWLDDLLNEPDSPVYKGHRRSASDSSAYIDINSVDIFNRRKESMFANFSNQQQWNPSQKIVNWVSESSPNSSIGFSNGLPHVRDGSMITSQNSSGLNISGGPPETDRPMMMASTITDQKLNLAGSGGSQNPKNSGENGECSQLNTSASRADAKHTKQKTAHRSRVRKLQYIAELERNVQVLQAEGSAVLAEIEFLDQHNLILSMENRALRQRLDSLSQEQLIKQLQHEMLERELGRLQALYQYHMQQQMQQQQQQRKQQNAKNNRAKFKDLDAHLPLNQSEAATSADSANSFGRN